VNRVVDSYRFIGGIAKRMVKSWMRLEEPREIPWTPLVRSLADCTVALISSGGIALRSDRPFDQEGGRRNPWRGDLSHRIIPSSARAADIRVYHRHIDGSLAERDLICLLPIDRLRELVE
jgi:D-proline reductase (dithiol) PrdB